MGFRSILKAIATVIVFSSAKALFISTGTTVALDGATYYIAGSPIATISIQPKQLRASSPVASFFPMTVVSTASLTFAQSDLESAVSNYTATDDVFNSAFLESRSRLSVQSINATSLILSVHVEAESEPPADQYQLCDVINL